MTYKQLTEEDKKYFMSSPNAKTNISTNTPQRYVENAKLFDPVQLNKIPKFKEYLLQAAQDDAVVAAIVLMSELQSLLTKEQRAILFLQHSLTPDFECFIAARGELNVEEAAYIFVNHLSASANLKNLLVTYSMRQIFDKHKGNSFFIATILAAEVDKTALPDFMELMHLWRDNSTFNQTLAKDETLLPNILTKIVLAAKYNMNSALLVLTSRYAQLVSNKDLLAIYKAHRNNDKFVQYIHTHHLAGGAYLLTRAEQDLTLACELLKTDWTNILNPIAIYNSIYCTHRYDPEFLAFIGNNAVAENMSLPKMRDSAPQLNAAINSSSIMPNIYGVQNTQLRQHTAKLAQNTSGLSNTGSSYPRLFAKAKIQEHPTHALDLPSSIPNLGKTDH